MRQLQISGQKSLSNTEADRDSAPIESRDTTSSHGRGTVIEMVMPPIAVTVSPVTEKYAAVCGSFFSVQKLISISINKFSTDKGFQLDLKNTPGSPCVDC